MTATADPTDPSTDDQRARASAYERARQRALSRLTVRFPAEHRDNVRAATDAGEANPWRWSRLRLKRLHPAIYRVFYVEERDRVFDEESRG